MTRRALILVDPQYDFMPGGKLPVPEGDEIVPAVNDLLKAPWDLVVVSQDWHPPKHSSFLANGGTWPEHCVQNSHGSMVHGDIVVPFDYVSILKGTEIEGDAYSAFCGRENLMDALLDAIIDDVYVCGLATDYCVKATALDSADSTFKTYLVLDACRGVNVSQGDSDHAVDAMVEAGVIVTNVRKVLG